MEGQEPSRFCTHQATVDNSLDLSLASFKNTLIKVALSIFVVDEGISDGTFCAPGNASYNELIPFLDLAL